MNLFRYVMVWTRGATSARWPKLGLLAPGEMHELRNQAERLAMSYLDVDALTAFRKDRKTIKRWGTSSFYLFVYLSLLKTNTSETVYRILGPLKHHPDASQAAWPTVVQAFQVPAPSPL
jgi:hypothetical protein